MQFAANLSLLFPADISWQERFERAAQQGFVGVELLFPYDHPPSYYLEFLQAHQLRTILINTPHVPGSMGYAALDQKQDKFQRSFDQAVHVAEVLQAGAIHVLAGQCFSHSIGRWQDHLYENLQYALEQIKGSSLTLHLEALNSQDVPDYAYANPLMLLPFLEGLNHDQVGLQFDFYHTLMEGLDLLETLKQVRPYLRHAQIASPHGRHEPDFDQYPELLAGLRYLKESHYSGWVGLEYRPQRSFEESLGFIQRLS